MACTKWEIGGVRGLRVFWFGLFGLLAVFVSLSFKSAHSTAAYPFDVTLETAQGRTSLGDLNDRPLILSFFFTGCASFCPVQTANLADVQANLPISVKNRSRFVSISLAPVWDDVATVTEYAEHFGIDQSHWHFAIPDETGLETLLAALELQTRPSKQADQIDHQMVVYLLRPDGTIVQRYVGHQLAQTQMIQDLIHVTYE